MLKTQQLLKLDKKNSTDLESTEFFNTCLIKFESNQILLNKISHSFTLTTKLKMKCQAKYTLKYVRPWHGRKCLRK
jgi:hypothetical protein